MRSPRWPALAAVVAGAALVLSGCANGDDPVVVPGGDQGTSSDATGAPSGPSPSGSSSPKASGPVPADLTISVDAGSGTPSTYTLTCEPAGGDHPEPDDACAALAAAWPSAFGPVPKDLACTEIYGGPETAQVTGTVDGQPVDTTFSRTNGCEIHRWDQVQGLLTAVSAPGS